MFLERVFVSLHVDFKPVFVREFFRHLDGESESIVKTECGFPAYRLCGNVRDDLFKLLQALLQGVGKSDFFLVKFRHNPVFIGQKILINVLILRNILFRNFGKGTLGKVDDASETHRTTDKSSQNIALVDVAWHNAFHVADKEGRGADMVGDYTHRFRDGFAFVVLVSRKIFDERDCGFEQVGFINRFVSVQNAKHTFKPHSLVDVLLFKRREGAVGVFEVLHKDVVADFDVLAAVARGRTFVGAFGFSRVDEHFGVGTARTGNAGGPPPVVFFRKEENAVFGDAHLFPEFRAFVVAGAVFVALENGNREFVFVEFKMIQQEVVRAGNCIFLKVITERPSAQHFKKRAVRRIADFFDIARADADLHVGQTVARGVFFAEKVRYEGVHARRREQYRRIVFGDKRRAGNNGVSL